MSRQLVIFSLGARRFGLHLFAVERVIRAVLVTALPHAPESVIGVINVQGQILPVLNLRLLLGLEEAISPLEIGLSDEFIVVSRSSLSAENSTSPRPVVLWVDNVDGVIEVSSQDWVALDQVTGKTPGVPHYFEGAVKMGGEIVLVCDPQAFLNFDTPGLFFAPMAETSVL